MTSSPRVNLLVVFGHLRQHLSAQQIHQPHGDGGGADVDGSAPERGVVREMAGFQVDEPGRAVGTAIPFGRVDDGRDLPIARAQGLAQTPQHRQRDIDVAPLQLFLQAQRRRLQSSVWSSMLGGFSDSVRRRTLCCVSGSYPAGTLTSATVRSVVSTRSIFSCGGTVMADIALDHGLAGQHIALRHILRREPQRAARAAQRRRSPARRNARSALARRRVDSAQPRPAARLPTAACRWGRGLVRRWSRSGWCGWAFWVGSWQ